MTSSLPPQPAPRDRVAVTQLSQFDSVIDVRSPAEFAIDHIPGAANLPVLNDDERARVGTLYKQSPFAGRKAGAALVAANIARHLEGPVLRDRQRGWKPLVYCWRGGQRSAALVHVLREIGWDAGRLDGGYKAYRRAVLADLPGLAQRCDWRVVCGLTGSGKSRLLQALADAGAQVLDLEGLAAHRGSVLGALPDAPQPSQKMFESRLWQQLGALDPACPVYVESESKKIGVLQVPQALLDCMWASPCIRLVTATPARVALLKEEYAHLLADADLLGGLLDRLLPLHGHAVIARWKELAAARAWDELVEDLLVRHYDPSYSRSIVSHYPQLPQARVLEVDARAADPFAGAARELMADAQPEIVA
jgi:tRNA 2-selenouridine synthase